MATGHGSKGEFRCLLCDQVLEVFDGTMEVAIRLTVQPKRRSNKPLELALGRIFGGPNIPRKPSLASWSKSGLAGLAALTLGVSRQAEGTIDPPARVRPPSPAAAAN